MDDTNTIEEKITLSGIIIADAKTNNKKNYAKFTIAYDATDCLKGEENEEENEEVEDKYIFVDFIQFAKNGENTDNINFELLKKGNWVRVHAKLRPFNYIEDIEEKTIKMFVVEKVEPITEAE
jgi:hypothetical protein